LYQDTVCVFIPDSPGWYQRRTVYHGPWKANSQSGVWSYTADVFSSSTCDDSSRQYQLLFDGSYSLTGKRSEDVQGFWNIDYRFEEKQLRTFTVEFRNWLAASGNCNIGLITIGNRVDIKSAHCPDLHLVPIHSCPQQFDIIRREEERIWFGSQIYGEPYIWHSICNSEDRPASYDEYGLAALGMVLFLSSSLPVSIFFNLNFFIL
jgi:hypothetical protein